MPAAIGYFKDCDKNGDYVFPERVFQIGVRNFIRNWYVYAQIGETNSYYIYAAAEILDQRPIPELCEILSKHYYTENLVKQLLSKGRIVHLGETISECVFVGDPMIMHSDPEHGSLFNKFIRYHKDVWLADVYGRFKLDPQPKGQIGLI